MVNVGHLWYFVDAGEGVEAPRALGLDEDADARHEGRVEDDGTNLVLRGQVHSRHRPDALENIKYMLVHMCKTLSGLTVQFSPTCD